MKKNKNVNVAKRAAKILESGTQKGDKVYLDNVGHEFDYKIAAQISSFGNLILGCFKYGFPMVLKKSPYKAFAFYPFFFFRADYTGNIFVTILHERIHIMQQRDIHLTVSLPLLVLCLFANYLGWFNAWPLFITLPFIPTIFYGVACIRSYFKLVRRRVYEEMDKPITFDDVKNNTCFEVEAISHSMNKEYLRTRKFWAILAYTGIKRFEKYGV